MNFDLIEFFGYLASFSYVTPLMCLLIHHDNLVKEGSIKLVDEWFVDFIDIGLQQRYYNFQESFDDDGDVRVYCIELIFGIFWLFLADRITTSFDLLTDVINELTDVFEEGWFGQLNLIFVAGNLSNLIDKIQDFFGDIFDFDTVDSY
jgi:hypothetical protein